MMFRQLPRWIWLGAAMLARSAGLIDAVAFSGFSHNAVTHITGTATKGAIALASGDFTGYFLSSGLIMAFAAGAIISGIIISVNLWWHHYQKIYRHYPQAYGQYDYP